MIGKLRGKVDAIGESFLIVDVNGVGYEVQASARTLRNLKIGEEVSLTIDTHVREDAIRLFGFASEVERSWFRTLQTRAGRRLQSGAGAARHAVAAGACQRHRARRLGMRRAGARHRQEARATHRRRIEGQGAGPVGGGPARAGRMNGTRSAPPEDNAAAEALSALTNLGYQPAQASGAIAVAAKELGEDADTAKLIRRGLKELAR